MSTQIVIEIPLEDLERDPILPPRIIDEDRLGALCRSLAERGMDEPILVRPAPDPTANRSRYFIILGYRRTLGAGDRLTWATVPAIVRDDLDDQSVLQIAFDADKTMQTRTALEDCWYYASMCAAGMTQAALAEREGVSEGKASMYVRVGNAVTPERIAKACLTPEDLAGFGITKLAAIASGPEEEMSQRITAAVHPPSIDEEPEPSFDWQERRNGLTRVILRTTDIADWSQEERLRFIERVGPLLAQARSVENLEEPAVGAVRSGLEEAHRVALIEAREARNEEIGRLVELNWKLLSALHSRREPQLVAGPGPDETHGPVVHFVRRALNRVMRWLRPGSTVEEGASMVEDSQRQPDPQIQITFDEEQVA